MAIGVPRPLALEKPQSVDLAQAARYFGAHGEPDAATLALLQKCAVPLLAAAMPRAVWLLADTPALTEAGLLPGEDVHKHLTGCGQAILLAVTLGPGVDAQIRRAGVGDIAAGVASDALGSALAEQAADAAEAQLRQWAATEGKYLTGRFSPGYGDWDIAVQPMVAAALDTVRKAGLCVTDTNLMTPRKSVTALLGASGIVFMLIMLASLAGMKDGRIPLTLILAAVLYLGQEVYAMVALRDNVANFMHLVGGVTGTVFGVVLAKRR